LGISPCEKGALAALGGGLFAVGNRPGGSGISRGARPSAEGWRSWVGVTATGRAVSRRRSAGGRGISPGGGRLPLGWRLFGGGGWR